MSSLEDTSIDKVEIQKRLQEIAEQMKSLEKEQEKLELKLLKESPYKHQKLIDNNSNTNTQSTNNSDNNNNSTMVVESTIKSQVFSNSQDPKQEEKQIFQEKNPYLKKETFTNFETLKFFFEEEWNHDFFEYGIYDPDGDLTKKQKLAYIKMSYFIADYYIDYYDEQIEKAQFKQADLDRSLDYFKGVVENLFKALITRSQVLELFEKCGKEAGIELYNPSYGVSHLQIYNNGTLFLLPLVSSLVGNPQYLQYFEWNFEKIRAVFELWQAGVVCGSYIDDKDEEEFYILYDKLLCFLNKKKEQFNEQQTALLEQILEGGKKFCDK